MEKVVSVNNNWTDERVAILKQMWNEGASAAEIANTIGKTRNAVIGKAHRLNLKLHDYRPCFREDKKVEVQIGAPRIRKPVVVELQFKPRVVELPPNGGIEFLNIKMHQCRAVLEGNKFCGQPVIGNTSWCSGHYKLFTVQAPKRVRAP